MCVQIRFPHRCLKGNYSCNRAVIFAVVLFFCYLYFGTTVSQQPQPHLNNHAIPTTAPTMPSPHHLLNNISTTTTTSPHHLRHNEQHLTFISTNAAIFSPATANPNEQHLRDRRGDSIVGAGADDFYNVHVVRMIPITSAHVRVSRRDRIRMTKGAEPAGGERSKLEDQTHPRTP